MSPFKVIIVDDPQQKRLLVEAMTGGGNSARVQEAPVTAIFAADLQAVNLVDELVQVERQAGRSPQYLRNLPFDTSLVASNSTWHPFEPRDKVRTSALAFGSRLVPLPTPNSSEAWAMKNTSLAAMTYMLGCSAFSLATHPMEGFDAYRVRDACGIPSRYAIPMVIPTGYAAQPASASAAGVRDSEVNGDNQHDVEAAEPDDKHHHHDHPHNHWPSRTLRRSPEKIFSRNHFDKPFLGVPEL